MVDVIGDRKSVIGVINIPFSELSVKKVTKTLAISCPIASGENWEANQQEFAMQVPGVGEFYASRGCEVMYAPVSRGGRGMDQHLPQRSGFGCPDAPAQDPQLPRQQFYS